MEPPRNVWRHLRALSKGLYVDDADTGEYYLELLKAMYGLNDAPLGWQLCLLDFLLGDLGGTKSHFDECFVIYFSDYMTEDHCGIEGLGTAHVDDNGVGGTRQWLEESYHLFVDRFGKVERQLLPFTHCGCEYQSHGDGIRQTQQEFLQKMAETQDDIKKADETLLDKTEKSMYRSQLGALLWLCVSRLDVIADACELGQNLSGPTWGHLRAANKVVRRLKSIREPLGLIYRPIRFPLCVLCVADSSHGTKKTAYANDALLTILAHDDLQQHHRVASYVFNDKDAAFGGICHVLGSYGRKAKRVSYSTSQGETTGAAGGQEFAQMIATRLSEILYGRPMLLSHVIRIWEDGTFIVPVDHLTDCADFYELACGERAMPQDKAQKLYVTSFREMRLRGKIRRFLLIPTESMLADALSKVMKSEQLMRLLSCGVAVFLNTEKHPISQRMLSIQMTTSEQDLQDLKPFENMLDGIA